MVTEVLTRRFTVNEYYLMAQAGILTEDDRVELIEGEIVEMAPIGSRHAAGVDLANRLLGRLFGDLAIVRVQSPVRLNDRSEPQPDLTLLRPRPDFYASGHPGPEDVLLLVEVMESSADYDRRVKLPLYARYGIPEVWLEDLESRSIEACWQPSPEGYRAVRRFSSGDSLSPQALLKLGVILPLAVADLLP